LNDVGEALMTTSIPTVKVAAIQAMPVFLDRTATTRKACSLIREAGEHGAEFSVFPEGFIPAHPTWFHHHVASGATANEFSIRLFENAVEIPGPETDELCAAARDAGTFVVVGVCERLPDTLGTMYNTQIFISPDGELLGKHQKFMPTAGERLVHTGGHGDTFHTFPSRYGPVSGLVCGENLNPLAIFALTAENTRIHGMSWPNYFALTGDPMRNRVLMNSQAFAMMSNSFVVSACSVVDRAMMEELRISQEDANILRDEAFSGGSVIVAPQGNVLAGPMGNEEGILYADCDFAVTVSTKLRQDLAGHYNRPDIFQLHVNRSAPSARIDLQESSERLIGSGNGAASMEADVYSRGE
jgi:nitrilase